MNTISADQIIQRLNRIENLLAELMQQRQVKEYYSTGEVAKILGRAEFTVREWCRNGRIWANKRECGRGRTKEWMISHPELQRVRNEGLLPASSAKSAGVVIESYAE